MVDFESGLKGIKCDANTVASAQYIAPVKNLVDTITDIKEDNFFHSDGTSLTEIAEKLTELDNILTQDTYFYLTACGGQKQIELQKIIEELDELKTKKMGVDPSTIGKDCTTYNDNVEAAILCHLSDLEVTELEKYKQNPYDLVVTATGINAEEKEVTEDVVVGKLDGNKLTRKSFAPTKFSTNRCLKATATKKDNQFSVPTKFNGSSVVKSNVSRAQENYMRAHSILTGRGFNTGIKMESGRTGDTSY